MEAKDESFPLIPPSTPTSIPSLIPQNRTEQNNLKN
jgi:hypothetical protein